MKLLNISILLAGMMFLTSAVNAKIFGKAKPVKDNTDFVEESMMRPRGDLPFNRVWKASKVKNSDYSEIYIAPVNTEYLRQTSWWNKSNVVEIQDDIDELAFKMRSKIRKAFWDSSTNRFRPVFKPGPKTLVLELAITELVPNKAGLKILLSAAGPASGLLAVSFASGAIKHVGLKSSIAMEVRIRDGGDGAIVAMYADREQEKGSIVNVRNYTWYGQIELIMDEWADQLVKVLNKGPRDIIVDTPTFSLKPW